MAEQTRGVSSFERIEALLANPELYELAGCIPEPEKAGRPRTYPDVLLLVYEALISVYGSARQVEAELSHPRVWGFIRKRIKRFDASIEVPTEPMRRHHYNYGRNRYLANPEVFERLAALHRKRAGEQAREIGLVDPEGQGSFTHPDATRLLYGDGKVITPLFRAKLGDTKTDKKTGEIRELRTEPDAALHFEGTGETAYGTKFVLVAARGAAEHSRMILDFDFVPEPGDEARIAVECVGRLATKVPGAQGLVYDTALRGVHHQTLLRKLGLMPINRVTAANAGAKKPRRSEDEQRVEKTVHVEDKTIGGQSVSLYARGGAVGIGRLNDRGEVEFVELKRIRTQRVRDKAGTYRWYNHYAFPDGGTVVVRLHGTDEDESRRFNRTENVRPIAPTDPDFKDLFRQRNDAESINRALEDTMYLRPGALGRAPAAAREPARVRARGQLARAAPAPPATTGRATEGRVGGHTPSVIHRGSGLHKAPDAHQQTGLEADRAGRFVLQGRRGSVAGGFSATFSTCPAPVAQADRATAS